MTNLEIIRRLRRDAREMARHGENLYRVRAYRQAAFLLTSIPEDVASLGPEGLRAAGLGESLAKTVYEWATATVDASGTAN